MDDCRPLIPGDRARDRRPRGVPIDLADGRTWVIAHGGTRPGLAPVRDSLYADVTLGGKVPMLDLWWAALALLAANYDVTPSEGESLLIGVEPAALADAVMAALFGEPDRERTYSAWVETSLRGNAIDPAMIPPEQLPWVLELLVVTKRAIPPEKWIDADVAATRFREAREMAEAHAAGRA